MTDMADNPELQVRDRGPGAALAAARTAQNLSVADVARQLKLSVSQVTALEAGEFERLPGPVFVRGFVRNYARLLRLDPDRLLDMLTDTPGAEPKNQMPTARGIPFPTSTVRRWPRLLLLLVLLVVSGLALYEFRWRDGAGFSPPGEPVTAALVPDVKPPVAATEAPQVSTTNEVSLQTEAKPAAALQESAPGAAVVLAEPTPVGPPAEGELHFTFSQDSWVQVQEAGGRSVFTRLNPAGTEQRVTGKPPFALVIGNAAGVRLSYNQQAVDLEPHIVRDGVARLTLK
ncbi:MAG TPA: helix-turn-helix domain-containing protein [Burkholderiales bacterium]|nr:helix-turn-helix domain-containing protein [Burkholderiales bacterium]